MLIVPQTECAFCTRKGALYFHDDGESTPDGPPRYTIACCACGHIFYYGNDLDVVVDELWSNMPIGSLSKEEVRKRILPQPETSSPVSSLKMSEAYEANKNSAFCVVCGKPTQDKSLFVGRVKYCACIEKLPR